MPSASDATDPAPGDTKLLRDVLGQEMRRAWLWLGIKELQKFSQLLVH
jgi:hypothetical protein